MTQDDAPESPLEGASGPESTGDLASSSSVASGGRSISLGQPRYWLIAGLLLVLGGGFLGTRMLMGSSRAQTEPAPASSAPAQAVTIASVEAASITRSLAATGTVAAYDLIPVLPKAPGLQLQQVRVDEGDRVSAGQVLAVLDSSVIQAQISQAEAEIASRQAEVRQRQASLAQAKARLADAESNLRRYQELAAAGAVSQQERDTRVTNTATAREAVRVAEADVGSAQANVASERARLQQLQAQLEQTLVRAPASGLVAQRIARVGNITSGADQLFSIIRDGLLELQVKVPETQLAQVQVGAPVQISSDSDSRIRFQGRVRDIAPLVDAQSRQATVRINLPNSELLRPGMFLKASLVSARTQGLTVPAKAVLAQPDGSAIVYVLDADNTVKARLIQTGQTIAAADAENARIEIVAGLKPGEKVVVAGAGYVKEGDRVNVVTQ